MTTSISKSEIATHRSARIGGHAESCPICGEIQARRHLAAPDRFHLRKELYQLLRCGACAGVWLASPPAPKQMGRHYTEDYHRAITAAGEGGIRDRWKNHVKVISTYKQGGAILDIGCSSGAFLSMMISPSWKLFGIEMEESTAQRARKATGAQVFVGEATAAPFSPGSFDVITSFDVLEHVYSPRQFLGKVRDWLKPGGIFYAMMPNIASWEARAFGSHWYGLELPRHLFHFSPRSLRCLMAEIGLEEVLVRTPRTSYAERSVGYLYSSLVRSFGMSPTPQAKYSHRAFPEKLIRKGIRVTMINPVAWIASLAGTGPCLEVVFRKPL